MASFLYTLLILVAWTWTPNGASALRDQSQADEKGLKCRITVFSTLERRAEKSIVEIEQTVCIPIVHGDETSTPHAIHLPDEIRSKYDREIRSGSFFVSIEGYSILDDEIILPDESIFLVLEESPLQQRRLNQADVREVLVIRITMSDGTQVGYSASTIRAHLFERDDSMARHMTGCLNGNIEMKSVGVFEVTVPGTTADYTSAGEIRNKAQHILAEQEGVTSLRLLADHVMVIVPENNFPNFLANAGVNHHVSTYNNLWSLDVMVYMHELGHNLGLNHAKLTNGQNDYSSNMSPTLWKPHLEWPLKCYNGAENALLGYLNSRTTTVDLHVTPVRFVTVAGFSEWAKPDNADPLLVSFGKYKMQYNLATAFNSGTEILRNAITIAYSEPTGGKTVVYHDGLVPTGAIFAIDNFEDTQKMLQVEACTKTSGNQNVPGKMYVAITLGIPGPPCSVTVPINTAVPSKNPSVTPSVSPSKAPSAPPSPSPNKSPSATPSSSPSKNPSAAPSTSLSNSPSATPSASPSKTPFATPSTSPSNRPSARPTPSPINERPSVELWLIDVSDGSRVMKLPHGGFVQIDARGSHFPEGFSIDAKEVGNSTVESVRFFKNESPSHFKNENLVPYAVAGDNTRGKYYPWTAYPSGTFKLSVVAYSGNRGTGIAGDPTVVQLEVLV